MSVDYLMPTIARFGQSIAMGHAQINGKHFIIFIIN